jgi:cyclopropane-fatty-acyl-phospholipid synthase
MNSTNSLTLPATGSHSLDTSEFPPSARIVLKLLNRIQHGVLLLHFPDGQIARFGQSGKTIELHINDWGMIAQSLKSGDIGFAESYIAGQWHTHDLPGLIELFARNRDGLEAVIYGNFLGKLVYLLKHALNRNSRTGSRRNIHAHYDIGNTFYRLWLDPSMTYSSALFQGREQSLHEAQQAKYVRLLREVLPDSNSPALLLEIGCGWGGFAELAARAGHQVHGITLSTEQLDYAQQRLAQAGLDHQTQFSLTDYRDTTGEYEAVVSIEMFEAVGEAYWNSYFRTVAQRLKPGGRAAIQTITIADKLFNTYRRSTDFIQQYIFPGGMLPSPSAFVREAHRAGLRVVNTLSFGLDYATTLALWRKAFHQALPEVRAQGFDERFIRTWDFYLAYCEAGFASQNTDVLQFTLVKN